MAMLFIVSSLCLTPGKYFFFVFFFKIAMKHRSKYNNQEIHKFCHHVNLFLDCEVKKDGGKMATYLREP